MKKEFDLKAIKTLMALLIVEFGGDVSEPGLIETPMRSAKMWAEMLEGMLYTNDEIATMFDKSFKDVESGDLVIVNDISIFSFCEHHIALMYNMKVSIGYIPNGKVLGLSKFARISEMVGKRLQLQERIGHDINEIIRKVTGSDNVIVTISGEHSCMTARGIKKTGTVTKTSSLYGAFKSDSDLRKEFYSLLK